MVTRVATYVSTNNLLSQTQRLQVNYAAVSLQSSSGLKADNFEGISADAQQLLALQANKDNLTSQATTIKVAQTRVNTLQNITSTIDSTLEQANSLLTNVLGGIDTAGGATRNVEIATTIRNELVSLLNTKTGDSYIFAGSVSDKAPVDLSASGYTPTAAPTTANTSYYQGDSTIDSVRASDSLRVTYGVTADNSAFEQALRGLTLFIADPTTTSTITNAFDLIKSAISGVGDISGALTAEGNVLDKELSLNSAKSDYLDQYISGLRDADTAQSAVKMSQLETQLQASYSAMSKLITLRLTDYLK